MKGAEKIDYKKINPIDVYRYIAVDPRVCHGKPCFRGTRVMVHLALELLEAGVPMERIIGPDYYPQLTKKHIQAAFHYVGDLLRTREYVA